MPDTSLQSPCNQMKTRIEQAKRRLKEMEASADRLRTRIDDLTGRGSPNSDLIDELRINLADLEGRIQQERVDITDQEGEFSFFCS